MAKRKYRRGIYPLVHPGRSRVRKPKVQSYQFRAVPKAGRLALAIRETGPAGAWMYMVYVKVKARYMDEAVEKALKIARRRLHTKRVGLFLLGIR